MDYRLTVEHIDRLSECAEAKSKARWRKIGHAYRHGDGNGLDLLYRTIPVGGRISLRINDQE